MAGALYLEMDSKQLFLVRIQRDRSSLMGKLVVYWRHIEESMALDETVDHFRMDWLKKFFHEYFIKM